MLIECIIRDEALLLYGTIFYKLPPKVDESSLCAKSLILGRHWVAYG